MPEHVPASLTLAERVAEHGEAAFCGLATPTEQQHVVAAAAAAGGGGPDGGGGAAADAAARVAQEHGDVAASAELLQLVECGVPFSACPRDLPARPGGGLGSWDHGVCVQNAEYSRPPSRPALPRPILLHNHRRRRRRR